MGFDRLGLTPEECRVYQILLSRGPGHAGTISSLSGIPRVRTYRTLASLEGKGFVKASVSRPMRFSACELTEVVSVLREEARLGLDLTNRLEGIFSRYVDANRSSTEGRSSDSLSCQIVNTERLVSRRIHEALFSAKGDLKILDAGEGIVTVFDIFGELLHNKNCHQRLLISLSSDETNLARPLTANYHSSRSETRFFDGKIRFNLFIKDGRTAILCKQNFSSALLTSDETIVEIFSDYFDLLWNQASIRKHNI